MNRIADRRFRRTRYADVRTFRSETRVPLHHAMSFSVARVDLETEFNGCLSPAAKTPPTARAVRYREQCVTGSSALRGAVRYREQCVTRCTDLASWLCST